MHTALSNKHLKIYIVHVHRILNDIKISFTLHFSLSQVNSFEAIENARKIHCMRK